MMENINSYLQTGYNKAGTWSKLATKLKVNLRTVTFWRQGKGYPNEKTILRLARYGGQDESLALLHLCMWRSSGKARKLYHAMVTEREGA